jgi:protein O-mannosyl-transferase
MNIFRPDSDRKAFFVTYRHVWICLFLVAITLTVYWKVQGYDFVNYDDDDYVFENPHVQGGISNANVIWALTTFHAGNWHPLTWLSHMLDYQLFGLKAGMNHLTSLLIHIANSILLFFVFRRMTGAMWRSAFIAALFALHPLHVESVAWISERKDVLSAFFWILTMWAYVRYAERPGFTRYILGLIFFALGLMSKPMIVTLPFVLLLMDFWPLCRVQWGQVCGESSSRFQKAQALRLVWEKIPLFALVLLSCFVTFLSEQGANTVVSLKIYPLSMRVSNALVSYTTYIRKTFWPDDLAVFYPYPDTIALWQTIGAGALLVCMFVLVFRVSRRFPYLVVGWLWYIGILVPVIGLVQVGAQGMADRYTYVPIIGLFIIVAWGVPQICQNRSHCTIWLSASVACLLLVLITVTWKQVGYWENSITLFEHNLRFTSNNDVAHNNLGVALNKQDRTEEAIKHFLPALQINPNYEEAHNNLGIALEKQGRTEEAFKHFLQALRIKPDYEEAHYNLGKTLDKHGRTEEAIEHLLQALRIKPDYEEAHNNLGVALNRQGRTDEAIKHFLLALQIDTDYVEAQYNLGNALNKQGRTDEAIKHLLLALRIKPDYEEAHNNLAIALFRKGDMGGAIAHFRKALRINPDNITIKNNLKKLLMMQQQKDD